MKRALIVDDAPESLLLLSTLLKRRGWHVDEASHGAEAFTSAQRQPPDLIVSDLLMPVMDGFSLLQHCRADERLTDVPFVVMTANYTRPDHEAMARNLGANAFLLKTTPHEELLAALEIAALGAGDDGRARADAAAPVPLRDVAELLQRKLEDACSAVQAAEARAGEAEARLTQILEALPAAAYTCDAEGRITFCNRRAVEFWGRSPRLDHPDERYSGAFRLLRADGVTAVPHDQSWMALALRGEPQEAREIVVEREDGSQRLALAHASPLRDPAGRITGAVNVLKDITERTRQQRILEESEERFRQVTETIGEVFWLRDLASQRVIYVSPAFEKVWGRPTEDIYSDGAVFHRAVHPDDRAQVEKVEAELMAGRSGEVEYRIRRPDGSERWIRDRVVPVRNAAGEIYRLTGVAEDVTTVRQLEERYRQAQKMEAVGQLAGGIAHDFNNLLTVIRMQGSLLAQRQDPDVVEGLRPIMDAAERAGNLTRQLLTFSRRQVKELRPLDLAETVGNLVRLLRRVLGEDVVLETRFAPALPLVNADSGMMEQVVMNLALNARDAMPNGGRIAIALERVDVDEGFVAANGHGSPGVFLRLSISDTGHGISAENLPHIFEPFFTTKDVGKGTGLGLATVFAIAQQHGGWVDVTSTLGAGSTFRVYFPALLGRVPLDGARGGPRQPAPGGNERILLVEDEVQVRQIASIVLRKLGYRVTEASSAAEAMQACRQGSPHDLLLTDLIMPGGVTGRQLAGILRDRHPGLRVVFMSGYSREIVDRTMRVQAGEDFLPKPFEQDSLATIVRRALDSGRGARAGVVAGAA